MPQPFTHLGKPYICQRIPIDARLQMQDAGFEQLADFVIEVRASQFVLPITPPAEQDVIFLGDVEYRIASAKPDQAGVVITYALKSNT